MNNDPVNHPKHYTSHPSGVECIEVTEHMGFNLGNATKYIWRADLKNDAIEDLKKARWYIEREIAKREKEAAKKETHSAQPKEATRVFCSCIQEDVSAQPAVFLHTNGSLSKYPESLSVA